MGKHVNYSGLVVAGVGFFLTRFTVTLAIYDDPTQFYLAGVVPLVLGLGLAAFGVALAVADVDADLARTTAIWCLVGAGTMLVLVVLTLLGSTTGGMPAFETARSRAYLSNFLIGGSVGGTLTGLYAARSRGQRAALRQQTNRLQVLNRLLRHEVLNSATVIRGYATLDGEDGSTARPTIEKHANAIVRTIEDVKHLTRSADATARPTHAVDIDACLGSSVETVRGRHPEAEIAVESPGSVQVRATDRVEQVFTHLLDNAVVHAETERPRVDVSVSAAANRVRVRVSDEGPGLPEGQRALLERGTIDEFDNPGTGFGLNIVRLVVESFRGSIETDVDADGSTVTVVLPRATGDDPDPIPAATGVRPALPHLLVTLGAAVIAGVLFGVSSNLLGGSIGIIGVLYGVADPVVGWITHEFHSIVFGFVFAGLLSVAPVAYRGRFDFRVALGTAWGLVLWLVAAGFVSAVWLRLVGVPAPIPNLSTVSLVNHVVWGVSLGTLIHLGYEHVAPRLTRFGEKPS